MNRIKKYMAGLLPGIFIIGYNVGTGTISSMSKAGANFGLDLLWTILISCLITYYLIVLFSRYTMATGETVVQGIKNHISRPLTVMLIILLSIIIFSALMGVLGIVADVLEAGSDALFQEYLPAKWWAVLVAAILYIVLWGGNYAFFKRILAILVAIMGLAFIITMIINFPPAGEIARGLIPDIPKNAMGSDNSPMVIVAGMVGTTVSVFAFIIRSQIIRETGWSIKDCAIQKRDAAHSAIMMFILSAAVMVTAASTLHVQGLKMNDVSEMVLLLDPIAGKKALGVFVVGIVAAGLSSHLPNLLIIPWLMIDFKDSKRDTRTNKYRLLLFILSIISLTGVMLGIKPIFIMLLSQACISIVLPLTLAAVFYLTSSKHLMHDNANKTYDHIILWLIMAFSIYMSYLGIGGLLMDLQNL